MVTNSEKLSRRALFAGAIIPIASAFPIAASPAFQIDLRTEEWIQLCAACNSPRRPNLREAWIARDKFERAILLNPQKDMPGLALAARIAARCQQDDDSKAGWAARVALENAMPLFAKLGV